MSGSVFLDSNIWIYADDPADPRKQKIAIELIAQLIREEQAIVSLQVMQEYFSIATKKLKLGSMEAYSRLELMSRLRVIRFEAEDVIRSVELHQLNRISFWGALIIHAARIGGADTLFSEDLQHGSRIAGVKIVNPFLESAAA